MKLLTTAGDGVEKIERLVRTLEDRGTASLDRVEPRVCRIVADVRWGGDAALLNARKKYDRIPQSEPLRVTTGEIKRAWKQISREMRESLRLAARNISKFAKRQMPRDWTVENCRGMWTGQRVRPLASVGCYVPSGRYPLPSTLLMTTIPAQVAGVSRIAVVTARPTPEVLAGAAMLGINEIYRVSGAHAVAALAYGTPSLPRVEKIVGPGNLYVTAAKRLVAFDCGIDMLAGPTEIVICSEQGDPSLIAADLIAQAEHDLETLSVFVTSRLALAKAVLIQVEKQAKVNLAARKALQRRGYAIVTVTKENAHSIVNRLAPEHLTVDREEDLGWVQNAGSVFVGNWSAQPLGDYVSGPNHTLPTGGGARVRGGLSVFDFLKLITVQRCESEAMRALGPAAIALANAEGLTGHAAAIARRLANV